MPHMTDSKQPVRLPAECRLKVKANTKRQARLIFTPPPNRGSFAVLCFYGGDGQ